MKKRNLAKNLQKVYNGFVIFLLIMYFGIGPILLYNEYKNNTEFMDSLVCEETFTESDKCLEIKELSQRSNKIVSLVILYWFLVIFVKDIWPNRDKIQKFLENLVS